MIGDNIKELRKNFGITQQELAAKVGITQGAVASVESGKRNISEHILKSISKIYGVRLEWLKTGEGEMYASKDLSIIDRLAAEYDLTPQSRELIENFLKLPPATRDLVAAAIAQAAENYPRKADSEKTKEEMLADVSAEADARDAARKRGTITSSVSTTSSGLLKKFGKAP